MKRYYRTNPAMRAKMAEILGDLYREFGWKSRLAAVFGGPYVLWKTRQEEKRLARGWTYEPPTFYERNDFVEAPVAKDAPQAEPCRYVTPHIVPERRANQRAMEPLPLATVK
jgi:hypothetical protein